MNILIISFDADPPNRGGVATVTNVLAKSFIAQGHFCALGFIENSEYPSVFFQHKVQLVKENRSCIKEFFKEHHFDIILNQLPTLTDFEFLSSLPLGDCKMVSVYHNRPMLHPMRIKGLFKIFKESNNFIYKLYTLMKIPLLPVMNFIGKRKELDNYRNIYLSSDRIVLLSDKFFPNWINLVPETEKNKLIAIGNSLVFDIHYPVKSLEQKELLIIVVANLNHVKRANILLRIWKKIEANPLLSEWNFEFIGSGDELNSLKKLATKLKLKRIKFVGSANPLSYYKRAQIMMLTSKYEGWPMVLMEGQQMGVVPISYNSFESITDIIDDNENGLIIPNNDLNCFVDRLEELMLNQQMRERMSENAVLSSHRFNKEIVANKYLSLFQQISAVNKSNFN